MIDIQIDWNFSVSLNITTTSFKISPFRYSQLHLHYFLTNIFDNCILTKRQTPWEPQTDMKMTVNYNNICQILNLQALVAGLSVRFHHGRGFVWTWQLQSQNNTGCSILTCATTLLQWKFKKQQEKCEYQ